MSFPQSPSINLLKWKAFIPLNHSTLTLILTIYRLNWITIIQGDWIDLEDPKKSKSISHFSEWRRRIGKWRCIVSTPWSLTTTANSPLLLPSTRLNSILPSHFYFYLFYLSFLVFYYYYYYYYYCHFYLSGLFLISRIWRFFIFFCFFLLLWWVVWSLKLNTIFPTHLIALYIYPNIWCLIVGDACCSLLFLSFSWVMLFMLRILLGLHIYDVITSLVASLFVMSGLSQYDILCTHLQTYVNIWFYFLVAYCRLSLLLIFWINLNLNL